MQKLYKNFSPNLNKKVPLKLSGKASSQDDLPYEYFRSSLKQSGLTDNMTLKYHYHIS